MPTARTPDYEQVLDALRDGRKLTIVDVQEITGRDALGAQTLLGNLKMGGTLAGRARSVGARCTCWRLPMRRVPWRQAGLPARRRGQSLWRRRASARRSRSCCARAASGRRPRIRRTLE